MKETNASLMNAIQKGTRSMELGQRAVDSLKKQTGSDKVSCVELDLTLFRSFKKFAAEIKKKVPQYQLQLLISKDL